MHKANLVAIDILKVDFDLSIPSIHIRFFPIKKMCTNSSISIIFIAHLFLFNFKIIDYVFTGF
jgi:hypothetical protein